MRSESGVTTNRILLLCAALLFSTGGAAIKMAALSGWQIASYRAGIATVFLWLILPAARRNWTWRTLAGGVVYAVMVVLFAAVALVLHGAGLDGSVIKEWKLHWNKLNPMATESSEPAWSKDRRSQMAASPQLGQ